MMAQPTIVKTTKDYMLVRIPMPPREPASFMRERGQSIRKKRELAVKDVLKIVADGERSYRRGKIKPVRSIRELMR